VVLTTDRGVAVLTLDSPRNRNALSARLRTALARGLREAAAEESVRAIVIQARGPAFCAGVDLKEVAAEREGHRPDPDAPAVHELLAAIMAVPKPVVARVEGPARAGGVGLVAAADIAVASEEATIAFSEVRIGVVPAMISLPVARRMQPRALERYFLTGEVFGASAAAEAGLVTRAVDAAGVDSAVDEVLDGLRGAAPEALAATKELLGGDADRRAQELARLAELSARYFASDDAAEGRAAFRERRPPRWAIPGSR
jgi:methylglutaconyl-CoA hydratase